MNYQKKNKTSEWRINETFYNIIKNRFTDLKAKMEKNFNERSSLKFECIKCKHVYPVEKAAHIDYHCSRCDDRPKLIEKPKE
jgi:Zn finger protein HypA/HybF involved in hydrogenase expression